MAKFKSRYKELSVNTGKKVIHFENYGYETQNGEEIKYLMKNQGPEFVCVSESKEKQNINALKLQARDLHYPGDVETASKDDLIQFIESKK